jgi:hypothetical protein
MSTTNGVKLLVNAHNFNAAYEFSPLRPQAAVAEACAELDL